MIALCAYLGAHGHKVRVMSSGGALARKLADAEVPHMRAPLRSRGPLLPYCVAAVRVAIVRHRVAIVHAHSAITAAVARLATLGTPAAVVCTGHGWPRAAYSQVSRLVRLSRCVMTVSREMASDLIHHGVPASKVRFVPNAIDLGQWPSEGHRDRVRQTLGVHPDDVLVTIVGRMVVSKGHESLLRAVAAGPRAGVRVLFVGDGPDRGRLEGTAAGLGLTPRTIFAGQRLEVAPFLEASDIIALPSQSEGMPVSLLEGMAARRPVVATRVGGVPDVVADGSTGILVPPGDIAELAHAIARLAGDPGLRSSMGCAGRERVEREFALDVVAPEIVAVYRHVLQGAAS
jgi:glycosyltransferase involved in cell wall biosynthesis